MSDNGVAIVTGRTWSTNFPLMEQIQNYGGDPRDAYVVTFTPSGEMTFSTYLGGSDDDMGGAIAINSDGCVYATGSTHSSNFPASPGAYDESHNGDLDLFVTKLFSPDWISLTLRWPLPGSISERTINPESGFGDNWIRDCPPGTPKLHTGIDIIDASVGEPVYAAESGTVKPIVDETGNGWAYGVTIEHDGYTTVSLHVDPSVTENQIVGKGELIGTVADLGDNTCLPRVPVPKCFLCIELAELSLGSIDLCLMLHARGLE